MHAIKCEGVYKKYNEKFGDPNSNSNDMWWDFLLSKFKKNSSREVLRGVSLQVEPGEFFGLLGPNGAGKTTLIKVLSTLLEPDAGTISINGFDLRRQGRQARCSLTVVQSGSWLGFDYGLSVRQNMEFWGRIYGLDRRQIGPRIEQALSVVGLSERQNDNPNQLSSGLRQRLAIAKGLMIHTPLLMLDEPTVGIDVEVANEIRLFVKQELNRNRGQTILLTSHDMQEVERLCDRVGVLLDGKIVCCDTPQNLVNHANLVALSLKMPVERKHEAIKILQGLDHAVVSVYETDTLKGLRLAVNALKLPDVRKIIADLGGDDICEVPATFEDFYMSVCNNN